MTKTPTKAKIRWFVYVFAVDGTSERIPHTAMMRGQWGYDVECSCGWKTNTGGAVRSYIEQELWEHKMLSDEHAGCHE